MHAGSFPHLQSRSCDAFRATAFPRQRSRPPFRRAHPTTASSNKSPTQVGEAARTLLGLRESTDDGNVQQGDTGRGVEGLLGRFYLNVTGFPFPLGPILARQTVRYEVVPDTIWTFEQEQSFGLTNVATTIRMTVVRLQSGDLWVYAPIAPTKECMDLLDDISGKVRYIVLPTHAYEHKIFVPPFQRRFPRAQVFVSPQYGPACLPEQWSFPLNLPLPLLGIFGARRLASNDPRAPWAGELECAVLTESLGVAPYSEAVFLHRPTRTLLVCDAVVLVPDKPPEVINRTKLLRAGKDNVFVRLLYGKDRPAPNPDEEAQQITGWQRMALLVLYFSPEHLRDPAPAFRAIANRLIVSPVLQFLVFVKLPAAVRAWVDDIARWDFERIISCHFQSPIVAGPRDFKRAFKFAYDMEAAKGRESSPPDFDSWLGRIPELPESTKASTVRFPEGDLRALQTLDWLLRKSGAVLKEPRN